METPKEVDEMFLPSLASGYWECTGSKNGMKCENSYALEAWFVTPFAMMNLVEIYVISTKSGPNTTHFGEPVCVIWYTYNKLAAKEGT